MMIGEWCGAWNDGVVLLSKRAGGMASESDANHFILERTIGVIKEGCVRLFAL